jgi:hypothetical protein
MMASVCDDEYERKFNNDMMITPIRPEYEKKKMYDKKI